MPLSSHDELNPTAYLPLPRKEVLKIGGFRVPC